MPAGTFKIKQGDRRPYLFANLNIYTPAGELADEQIDLSVPGMTGVVFSMRSSTGTLLIDKADVVVDDVDERLVHYEWLDGDTDVDPGTYYGEFQVNYEEEAETFPNSKIGFKIKITEQIA